MANGLNIQYKKAGPDNFIRVKNKIKVVECSLNQT
jgi:hypothetical protein